MTNSENEFELKTIEGNEHELYYNGMHIAEIYTTKDTYLYDIKCALQENTKLKAEIEQLKHQIETRIKVSEGNFNAYLKLELERDNLKLEIEELKSELEQSVKEKSEVISKIEYALNECEPIYNKCAVIPQAKPVYDLAMNYCLDLLKGQVPE